MELDLKDKVAVVTGASKGIGLTVVKVLGREGVRVVAGSRTQHRNSHSSAIPTTSP